MSDLKIDGTNPLLEALGDKAMAYIVRIDNKTQYDRQEPLTGLVIQANGYVEFELSGEEACKAVERNIKQMNELIGRGDLLTFSKTEMTLSTESEKPKDGSVNDTETPSGDKEVSEEPSETVETPKGEEEVQDPPKDDVLEQPNAESETT